MSYVFRDPLNRKRRLITVSPWKTGESATLLNYWAMTTPTPGYEPIDYPGLAMYGEYATALQEGQRYLGYSYSWGGKVPPYFDCSGFVSWCYYNAGIFENYGLGTSAIMNLCYEVEESEAYQGDLCFYGWGTPNVHVEIYIGNGYIMGSSPSLGTSYKLKTYHESVAEFNGYFRVIGHSPVPP